MKLNISANDDIDVMKAYLRRVDFALVADVVEASPIGHIVMFGGVSAPLGWLLCDGTAVSRTQFVNLLNVIGTAYGVGDGSTTFNVPNLVQRFPLGKALSGTGATLGATGGAIDATFTIPAHYHGMGTGADLNITDSGLHDHEIQRSADEANNGGTGGVFGLLQNSGTPVSNTQGNTHTHASGDFAGRIGLVTGGVDGNAAMTSGSNNPPFVTVNFIIRYQ